MNPTCLCEHRFDRQRLNPPWHLRERTGHLRKKRQTSGPRSKLAPVRRHSLLGFSPWLPSHFFQLISSPPSPHLQLFNCRFHRHRNRRTPHRNAQHSFPTRVSNRILDDREGPSFLRIFLQRPAARSPESLISTTLPGRFNPRSPAIEFLESPRLSAIAPDRPNASDFV